MTAHKREYKKKMRKVTYFIVAVMSGAVMFTAGSLVAKTADAAYTHDVPYQVAVPDFIDAVTNATAGVKDQDELDAIAQWEEDARARLPEFLNDLIFIAQQLEANGSEEFVVQKYTEFADKWNAIAQSYPGLAELEPVIGPILDQLVSGLPVLQSTTEGNPAGNLYNLHVQMYQLNPWGTGEFWNVPPVESALKTTQISEHMREEIIDGFRSIRIVKRDVVVTLNGVVVFSEFIQDGELLNRAVVFRDPSVIHEALAQMVAAGEDQQDIDVVSELVDLADLNLELALDSGVIDDCSYSYIYRKQLAGGKATCVDINGEVQNLAEISKYDPFDHVNQVELSRLYSLSDPTLPLGDTVVTSSPPSTVLVADNADGTERLFSLWFIGVMLPAYLWSLVGVFRMV